MGLTTQDRIVRERSTALYAATIQDENETAIPAADLDTLTLTLYDLATGTAINSRSAQNVLNANNVTVSVLGALAWTMQPADNAIIGSPAGKHERHVALFQWTYGSGKAGSYEVIIDVENLAKVPAA